MEPLVHSSRSCFGSTIRHKSCCLGRNSPRSIQIEPAVASNRLNMRCVSRRAKSRSINGIRVSIWPRLTQGFESQQQSEENQNRDVMRMIGGDYDSTVCNIWGVSMVWIRFFWSEGAFSRDL